MRIARDLGYTLQELMQRMTYEEFALWGALYEAEYQEQEAVRAKGRHR